MDAQELLDGYDTLFDTNTRLAHEAVLLWASENEPDGWPTPATVLRFARFYGVVVGELAGLCGILPYRLGNRTVFCDARRHPAHVHITSADRFNRRALIAYGFYNTAATLSQAEGAAVH
jgi:hypothetical protein